jgi:ketosteroid isomerase-like protein
VQDRLAGTSRADVVRGFYAAIAAKDVAALNDVVTTRFAEDIALVIPASLPYGGTVTGASKLGRMFTAMASAPTPMGATDITVVDVVDGGDVLCAAIEFEWIYPGTSNSVSSGALEVWRFAGDRVVEIRAYYADTAALLALAP